MTRNLLRFNKILNIWMLVDTTVIHHDHGVGGWKGLHMIKGTLNEYIEAGCVKSTFDDVAMEDTFVERQCR